MKGLFRKASVLVLAAIVIAVGFGIPAEQASAITGPTSITIAAESLWDRVDYNSEVRINLTSVYPSYRAKSVTWSVYSGSQYGRITGQTGTYCNVMGLSYGTVVIKARSNYYPYATKYINIYVRQLYPTAVNVDWPTLNMWAGTAQALHSTVTKDPWVDNSGVAWTSSNGAVATVDSLGSLGVVRANKAGTTNVVVTSKDLSTLQATCIMNVYQAALTTPDRVNLPLGGTPVANPVNVTGPLATTTSYSSSNTAVATVSNTGTVTAVALGSATITATVTLPYPATNTKTFTYVVNVGQPVGVSTTSFDVTTANKLQIVSEGEGYMGDRSLLFSKQNLDDFFGFGSLGVDLWNPMDMHENFFIKDIAWHIGGFTFDKVGNDVEVTAMVNQNTWAATYVLNPTESLDMIADSEDIYTGYDLQFFYEANSLLGYDLVTLRGDVLTIPFGGDTLQIKRLGYNKIQVLAAADSDGIVNDVVMTITRNTTGYHVVIDNTTYMTNEGISFNLYNTYI